MTKLLENILLVLIIPFRKIDNIFNKEFIEEISYAFWNNELFVAWRNMQGQSIDIPQKSKVVKQNDNETTNTSDINLPPQNLNELLNDLKTSNYYSEYDRYAFDVKFMFRGDENRAVQLSYNSLFSQRTEMVGGMHIIFDGELFVLQTIYDDKRMTTIYENKEIHVAKPKVIAINLQNYGDECKFHNQVELS